MKGKTILLLFFIWYYSSTLIAQELPVETPGPGNEQEQNMEEITVIGLLELHSLKFEAIRAEDLKYEIFNSLNSTDDFDITCERRAPTGTHIQQRFCEAGYIKKAKAKDAHDFLFYGFGHIRSDQELAVQFASKTEALNKEMIALAVKHPELATAMIRANGLQQRYLAERREKFKNSILIGHPMPEKNIVVLNELEAWQIAFLDHENGAMTNEIWNGWDSWYKTLFRKKSYRSMWASAKQEKYTEAFIEYVNAVISK